MKLESDHSHSTPCEPSYVCMLYICRSLRLFSARAPRFPLSPIHRQRSPTPETQTSCEKLLPTGEDSRRIQQTALKLVKLPIESIALSTHERSLWSRSDPPNNSHETPLPFPPVPSPCSTPPVPLARIPSLPALSFLPLPLPLAPLRARRLRSHLSTLPLRLSLSLPFASTSAQSRVWVCAVVPRCFSPTTRLPLSPHWGHRVARYRSAISRIPASPRDAPISAMAARPEL